MPSALPGAHRMEHPAVAQRRRSRRRRTRGYAAPDSRRTGCRSRRCKGAARRARSTARSGPSKSSATTLSAPGARVQPVDPGRLLLLLLASLVVGLNAVGRIGEPDRPVGLHDDVVGRVQALALEAVGEHRHFAVEFGAQDAAVVMRAGDQTTLAVARLAVGKAGRLAEDLDAAALRPTHDPVVRDVAHQQTVACRRTTPGLPASEIRRPASPTAHSAGRSGRSAYR